MKKRFIVIIICTLYLSANAQTDTLSTQKLNDVTVSARRSGTTRMGGAINGLQMNRDELFKAACCNLGESFTTNPSVDVNYSDATTGAKQIKLLGLSGTYVQMLTENLPNFRGSAMPYSLGYVPGAWMKSISVSKGASSVRNGYESITGQIDIEYLKPEDEEGLTVNLFGDTKSRFEANADANIHIIPPTGGNNGLNTELLVHYENDWGHHDDNNDGFLDKPNVQQYNLQNRWDWIGSNYIFHGGIAMLNEKRTGGQTEHTIHNSTAHTTMTSSPHLYKIDLETNRYEAYMKHAFVLNRDHGTNIAIMTNSSLHELDATYGHKTFEANEKNLYTQLMFETNITDRHNLSAGVSLNYDFLKSRNTEDEKLNISHEKETTPGIYAQYTLNLNGKLTAMGGLRMDHSSLYGTFITPRFHLKYMPNDILTLRLSAGKGYRTVHALAENNFLLASGRTLVIDDLQQERAWNYGISSAFYIPFFCKTLRLNAEYYYTQFSQQAVIDYDSDLTQIRITNLNGKSYSHTFQIDASYPIIRGIELTAAYRLNDVRTTFGGKLMEKPLTSKYKGLITISYKTPLGLWQADATLQFNGGGRMPTPLLHDDGSSAWDSRFPSYAQLNAQLTRWFRHFSVYIGGENLTDYIQKRSIIHADDPWSSHFDPTMIWGPVHGAMFYAGIRLNFGKRL